MPAEDLNDLAAFLAVARERSFTRAAAKLGVSQSGAKPDHPRPRGRARHPPPDPHHPKRRADRGGRRSSDCGAAPRGDRGRDRAAQRTREKPAGTIRITGGDHAIHSILWPNSFLRSRAIGVFVRALKVRGHAIHASPVEILVPYMAEEMFG